MCSVDIVMTIKQNITSIWPRLETPLSKQYVGKSIHLLSNLRRDLSHLYTCQQAPIFGMSVSEGWGWKLFKTEWCNSITGIKHCTSMCRLEEAYLFPSENMSGQFDHSKVSTSQRLVQVIQPRDLPIMMTFESRHGCWWTRTGVTAFCCLLRYGQFSISSWVKLGEVCSVGCRFGWF